MAFGFGFNKQKVLSAAEKCVQQGKLQNAIAEYEKVLKADPKDLTVMNTVGDLHSRLGESDRAAECFKSVGDAYAAQGFTVKAIAMYKKLSKLKASTECVLRLAELYTQQGLFNDARAQYLVVAEDFLKSGQLEQAARIFEKTLEMDPDNVSMRTKLAEVYIRMGKKPEAWKILTSAAEGLRAKGQLSAADEILQRMLKLEPGNSYALILRGRAALDAGDNKAAIEALTKIGDLDTNQEAMRALFQAYLRTHNFPEASPLAAKLANVHDDTASLTEYADALMAAQQYREALQFYAQHVDRFVRTNPAKLVEALRPIIGYVREDADALETVLALYQQTGDTTHTTEIYELLAHAYVQADELDHAREYYMKLMQLEPANAMHAKNYQQVMEKQGTSSTPHMITAEEGSVLVDELEATAPFIDQRYDDEVALAVRAALTDAELFISYNMPAKALEPLLSALPKAPRDLRMNQKLAALQTRAGKFAEAAVCCRTLESIYHDAGHAEEASRYGDLAAKYEDRSSGATAKAAEVAAPADHSAGHTAAPEFEISAPVAEVHEATEPAAAPQVKSAPTVQADLAKQAARSGLFFHSAPAASRPEQPVASAATVAEASEFSVAPSAHHEAEPAHHEAVAAHHEGEVDLSGEWEQDLSVEHAPIEPDTQPEMAVSAEVIEPETQTSFEPAPVEMQPVESIQTVEEPASQHVNLDEAMEEVRFYLGQGMIEQADLVLSKLEPLAPESPELAVLRLGIESAKQGTAQPEEPEVSVMESAVEAESAPEPQAATPMHQPWPSMNAPAEHVPAPHEPQHAQPEAERPVLQELVSQLEQSLGSDFLSDAEPAAAISEVTEAVGEEPTVAGSSQFRSGTLDEFVSDLEASLGSDFPQAEQPAVAKVTAPQATPQAVVEAPVARAAAASVAPVSMPSIPVAPARMAEHPPAPAAPVAQAAPEAGVDLANMFGELKEELEGEVSSTDEDPETHYNLGVAFREMGLLDEAIGEFQKVCQSADRGHAFPQMMQTYTWLAQCFLDKGIPEAAIRWYETALKMPSLDRDTKTALHYELASSFETAGNNSAALSNFLEVYGSNIDYRDVAERIKALRP